MANISFELDGEPVDEEQMAERLGRMIVEETAAWVRAVVEAALTAEELARISITLKNSGPDQLTARISGPDDLAERAYAALSGG